MGARVLGLQNSIGSLTPGKCADLVMLRCDDLATMHLNNLAATEVLAADRRSVDIVDGAILKCCRLRSSCRLRS
jgi:cytosine/adenosine deaminase-related metal-dependent hydrolase